MKRIGTVLIWAAGLAGAGVASAFPPAPHHEVYGMVRDGGGNPVGAGATVVVAGESGDELMRGLIDPGIGLGVNYSVKVPMDAGTVGQRYQRSAWLPAMPFTMRVRVGEVEHVPMEVSGGALAIGEAGGRTRLDLTLGVDSDGDGLPDAWEAEVVAAVDGVSGIGEVTRDGDSDGDGVSNYTEYLAGTYAFDRRAVFRLDIVEVADGVARLRFLAVEGRSYRVTAGGDGGGFEAVEFAVVDGGDEVGVWRAATTRYEDVFVEVGDGEAGRLFRLHVD